MFDTSTFDLSAYLERLAYGGSTEPTLQTLQAIALHHPMAIPFENLDPFLRRPVSLDIDALQRKIVQGGRGGWCFEHNTLLGSALTALGYQPAGLAARVMWNVPTEVTPARSHMVLLLQLGGRPYIVDAGFGGVTLTAPLRLEVDLEQDTPHERFRIIKPEDSYIVQAHVQGDWRSLYRFDLTRQMPADYEVSNWFLCTNPRSIFLTMLMAARVERDRRYALRTPEFATHHRGGPTERCAVTSGSELRQLLETVFRIPVPREPDVDEALNSLCTRSTLLT